MNLRYKNFECFKDTCFNLLTTKKVFISNDRATELIETLRSLWNCSTDEEAAHRLIEKGFKLPIHVFYNELNYVSNTNNLIDLLENKSAFFTYPESAKHEGMNKKQKIPVSRSFNVETIDRLICVSGVYAIFDKDKNILYVGRSTNLADRIYSSVCKVVRTYGADGVDNVKYFSYVAIPNTGDMCIYEIYFITKYRPKFNSEFTFADMPSINLPKLDFEHLEEIVWIEGFLDEYKMIGSTFKNKD